MPDQGSLFSLTLNFSLISCGKSFFDNQGGDRFLLALFFEDTLSVEEGMEIPEQKVRVLRTFGPRGLLDSFIWKEHDRHSAGQVLWGR
jgi:hypothetical protein